MSFWLSLVWGGIRLNSQFLCSIVQGNIGSKICFCLWPYWAGPLQGQLAGETRKTGTHKEIKYKMAFKRLFQFQIMLKGWNQLKIITFTVKLILLQCSIILILSNLDTKQLFYIKRKAQLRITVTEYKKAVVF